MKDHSAPSDASEAATPGSRRADGRARDWQSPRFEVVSLSCEISAYAPDGGDSPLY